MPTIGDHLLPDRGTFSRPRTVPLGGGKFKVVYEPVLEEEPCRVAPLSGMDMTVADKEKARATRACYMRPGSDVHVGYRAVIGGITYGVTVRQPPSLPHHLKVLLAEIQLTPSAVAVSGAGEVVE